MREAEGSLRTAGILMPAIHTRPTGGNVFNRRVLDVLAATLPLRRRVLRDGDWPSLAPGLWLVDSLLLDAVARRLAAGAPGVTAVLLVHHLHLLDPEQRQSGQAAAERRLLPLFAGAVATSRYSREALQAAGLAPGCVVTVAPGLDARYRTALPLRPSPGPPRVLTVASLLPGKGLLELLAVLEECADLPWRWEVAGDPELDPGYAQAFAARLRRSPVSGRVRLRGPLPPARLAALYDRCHLFALASRFESCGMAVREAMARGLPVAAYAVGGLPESLPPETAHLLAPAGDAGRLGTVVRRLLADPGARAAAGRANRRAAAAFPSWEESGAGLERFLRGLGGGAALPLSPAPAVRSLAP